MGVRLVEVLAGTGDVEGHPDHLDAQCLGGLQQVPTALQRGAEGHAGLGGVGLCGQLQQQPARRHNDKNQNPELTEWKCC